MAEPADRHLITAMLMSLVLCVTACGSSTAERSSPKDPVSTASAGSPTVQAPGKLAKVQLNAQAAADKALVIVPGSAVVEVESRSKDGRTIWEVVVRRPDGSGTELYIDQATGSLLKQEPADVPRYLKESAPTISASAAMSSALSSTPGIVEEVGLSREDGGMVWEVKVAGASGRVKLYIDATSGKVIKTKSR